MTITRRFFLRSLPAASLAARQAKAALQEKMLKDTGIGVQGGTAGRRFGYPYGDEVDDDESERKTRQVLDFLRTSGIPKWKREDIRREARRVHVLSVNIAALQSVSMAGKFEMQAKENERKRLENLEDDMERGLLRRKWLKDFGLDWF